MKFKLFGIIPHSTPGKVFTFAIWGIDKRAAGYVDAYTLLKAPDRMFGSRIADRRKDEGGPI